MTDPPAFLVVATVQRAHGVHGELKVRVVSDDPDRLRQLRRVWIDGAPFDVHKARPFQDGYLVVLAGVTTREAALALRGRDLEIPTAEAAPLPADRYYHHQLVGLAVVTAVGASIGTVREILETGANDVLVVHRGGARDVLVPFVEDVVRAVDLAGGRIVIEPLPGLLD